MAIPSSGQLALSTIRDEFGAGTTSNVNLRTLSAAAGLSVPDGFNEFYGLSAYTAPAYVSGASSISGSGTAASPYTISPNRNPASWTGDDYYYYSYNWGRYVTIYDWNCSQPDEQFKNIFIQAAGSLYMSGLTFSNRFAGAQRMKVKFISSNINFNSGGYTGTSFYSNVGGLSFNVQGYFNAWTNGTVNQTATSNNFTVGVNSNITLDGGFTQWSLEGNAFGSAACNDYFNESLWEVYLDVPAANYKLSMSSFVTQVWFEPV